MPALTSDSLEISYDSTHGSIWRTKKIFKKGEIIWKLNPDCATSDINNISLICAKCLITCSNSTKYYCQTCKYIVYCSENCQKQHLDDHKFECASMWIINRDTCCFEVKRLFLQLLSKISCDERLYKHIIDILANIVIDEKSHLFDCFGNFDKVLFENVGLVDLYENIPIDIRRKLYTLASKGRAFISKSSLFSTTLALMKTGCSNNVQVCVQNSSIYVLALGVIMPGSVLVRRHAPTFIDPEEVSKYGLRLIGQKCICDICNGTSLEYGRWRGLRCPFCYGFVCSLTQICCHCMRPHPAFEHAACRIKDLEKLFSKSVDSSDIKAVCKYMTEFKKIAWKENIAFVRNVNFLLDFTLEWSRGVSIEDAKIWLKVVLDILYDERGHGSWKIPHDIIQSCAMWAKVACIAALAEDWARRVYSIEKSQKIMLYLENNLGVEESSCDSEYESLPNVFLKGSVN